MNELIITLHIGFLVFFILMAITALGPVLNWRL